MLDTHSIFLGPHGFFHKLQFRLYSSFSLFFIRLRSFGRLGSGEVKLLLPPGCKVVLPAGGAVLNQGGNIDFSFFILLKKSK